MARRPTGGRLRAAIFLIVSVVSAAIASFVIWTVLQNFQEQLEEASAPIETVEIVVAARDLPQGMTITLEHLAVVELPPSYAPDAVYTDPEELVGRVPQERILTNEFVREERLADPEAGLGLNAIIPRGMRAISINITNGSAVSGFLNPGNYVDVLVTIRSGQYTNYQNVNERARTVTMLQAVKVLAVNNRGGGAKATERASPSVTLAVTPDQAERVAHAHAQGAVTLTLRNDIDVTQIDTHGEQASVLIGADDAQRVPVSRWREQTRRRSDGSLIIIRGDRIKKDLGAKR